MKRQISFGQALATVVGTVIGGGVFFKIGSISYETGTPSLTLFVWILAGIVSIASGLSSTLSILMEKFGAFYLAGLKC